jgi:hypothetical protein
MAIRYARLPLRWCTGRVERPGPLSLAKSWSTAAGDRDTPLDWLGAELVAVLDGTVGLDPLTVLVVATIGEVEPAVVA